MNLLEHLPQGLSVGTPAELYHRRVLGVVSNSALKQFSRTPRHYRAWVDGLDKESPALDFGRAFHCALLEPERFAAAFPILPEFKGTGSVKARETWVEDQGPDAQPIKREAADRVAAMVASVREHPVACAASRNGIAEATMVWQDDVTGLWHKARPDYYRDDKGILVEVKSCRDASPAGFVRAIAEYRYHVGAAMYVEGLRALDKPLRYYVMLAIESEPPHCCATYSLSVETECRGFEILEREREHFAACLRADFWPAYSDKTLALSLPRWALTD